MTPLTVVLASCACILLSLCAARADEPQTIEWHDATALTIEGKGWNDTQDFFDRLPARSLSAVNDDIKGLAKNSTGMAIRFASDTDTLRFRWTLGSGAYVMTHMAATGSSGLDLYTKLTDGWAYLGTGRPDGDKVYEWQPFAGRPKIERTYLLDLPLFNQVKSLSIGVTPGSSFAVVPNGRGKTVVFYGTSIVNGGCAARPGMAYPAIIGRALDCETINLGFSGAARMEPVICDLLAELNPDVYVIDALPNMSGEPVTEKTLNLVRTIRKRHPATPILLVENITYQASRGLGNDGSYVSDINAKLRDAYRQLIAEGCPGLSYIEGSALLGSDGEGTVDGSHPTDLGFARMAAVIGPAVERALSP